MIATPAKQSKASFPRAKIAAAVKSALPKGQTFKLHVAESPIRRLKIVRVVTPAWKTLWAGDRIRKVLKATDQVLTPAEQDGILRFSVLTPKEYQEFHGRRPATSVATRPRAAKKLAASRKAKRALAK
jgi:hypothetical protein